MTTEATAERKLNILHTVRSLRVDGVVKVILRNMSHRDTHRFNHHVCSLRDESDLADECRGHGIEPIFLGHTGIGSAPRTVARLRLLMRRLKIDVVHANRTLDLMLAGAAAKLSGIPVVSSLHWLGRLEDHPEDQHALWLWRWLEMNATVLFNRMLATRIIMVSHAVNESFLSLAGFPRNRADVVYPGLDMQQAICADDAERLEFRQTLGLGAASPILLNIGRLDVVKGQRHLIPMMRRVRQRMPHAKLLIAGEGELRGALQDAIAAAGLEDAIGLIGLRSDIDALLGISDLLILSSESEAAPLPLFEAMRAGKPVVATAVGGVREMVQPGVTGLIVPRGDPEAMAKAVLRVLETPGSAQRMGEAARRLGLQRFNLSASVRALENIYLSLSRRPQD